MVFHCGFLSCQGKFGGLQNKAPPLERMRGAVFAAPLPLTFHTLTTQIGEWLGISLNRYRLVGYHAEMYIQLFRQRLSN